jgi:hypothetical protein
MNLLQHGANAYFEKSKLDSDEGWQSVLALVEEMIGTPQAEPSEP